MNKSLIVCVLLGSSATIACAQDTEEPGRAVKSEAAGGHDVAVFTGVPERQHGADWATPGPRGAYVRDSLGVHRGDERIVLGRQYNLEYLTKADVGDPFHTGTGGKASNLVNPSGTLADSGVRYYSSQFDHISTGSSWTADTLGGNSMSDRAWGMTVGVDYGPLSLRAAHQNRHVAHVQLYNLAGNNMDAKNSIVAANLRTRWGTAYAAYAANRGWGSSPLYNPDNPYAAGVASTSSSDSRDTLAGVAVPMSSATTFLASFIHRNDRDLANRDANMIAFGASYVMSRKTDFYAAFSHTVNTNGSGILIGGAARPTGSSAVNVGMRHAF